MSQPSQAVNEVVQQSATSTNLIEDVDLKSGARSGGAASPRFPGSQIAEKNVKQPSPLADRPRDRKSPEVRRGSSAFTHPLGSIPSHESDTTPISPASEPISRRTTPGTSTPKFGPPATRQQSANTIPDLSSLRMRPSLQQRAFSVSTGSDTKEHNTRPLSTGQLSARTHSTQGSLNIEGGGDKITSRYKTPDNVSMSLGPDRAVTDRISSGFNPFTAKFRFQNKLYGLSYQDILPAEHLWPERDERQEPTTLFEYHFLHR